MQIHSDYLRPTKRKSRIFSNTIFSALNFQTLIAYCDISLLRALGSFHGKK